MSKNINWTDESTELANFFQRVASFKQKDPTIPCFVGICEFAKFDVNQVSSLQAVSEIVRRCRDFNLFIENLDDDLIDMSIKDSLRDSVKSLVSFASPMNFGNEWKYHVTVNGFAPHINNLRLFGRTARDYNPINKVSEADIGKLRSSLAEAYNELIENETLPEWALRALLEGMERIEFRLVHFDFFGHDAIISELIRLRFDAELASKQENKSGPSNNGRLVALGIFILAATQAFIRPAEVMQAIATYKTALSELMADKPLLLSPPQKQITGPSNRPSEETTDT